MYNNDTPIWQLTVSEFMDLHRKIFGEVMLPKPENYTAKKYVYGLAGLASLLGCSTRNASIVKASGKLDGAIIQEGRKIIIDSEKAMQLLKK